MYEISIGELLERQRKEKGYSKSVVCRGLCSVTALSRYENGMRIPDKFLLEYLLQRLGCHAQQYEMIISNEEFDEIQQQKKIEELIEQGKYSGAEDEIGNYKKMKSLSKAIHEQYVFYYAGLVKKYTGEYTQAVSNFEMSLSKTIVQKEYKQCGQGLLSFMELKVFRELGDCYQEVQRIQDALAIYLEIQTYLENHSCISLEIEQFYYGILYKIAEQNYQKYNYGDAYSLIQKVYTGMTKHYFVKHMKDVLELKMVLEEKMNLLTVEAEQDYKNKIMALELLKCTDEKEMLAFMEEKNVRI